MENEEEDGIELNIDLINPTPEDKINFLKLNKAFWLYGPTEKLYRGDIVREYGMMFPENVSYGEDLIFNMEYYSKNL